MSVELEVMESTFPVSGKGIIAEAKRVIEGLLYAGNELHPDNDNADKDMFAWDDAENTAHAFLLELSHAATAPPRPLQPGDKVLVEGTIVEGEIEGDGRSVVRFDKLGYDVLVSLSSIRPFPQEEPDHAN